MAVLVASKVNPFKRFAIHYRVCMRASMTRRLRNSDVKCRNLGMEIARLAFYNSLDLIKIP